MPRIAKSISLSRQVVGYYLAFALGGLLSCLVATLFLASRGMLIDLIPVPAVVSALVLSTGAILLYHTVRSTSRVQQELLRLSSSPDVDVSKISALEGTGPVVRGWNAFIDRLAAQESLQTLQHRLSATLQGRQDRHLGQVLNSLPDGVAVTHPDGRILLANRALAAFVDCESFEKLNGQLLLDILHVRTAFNGRDVERALHESTGTLSVEMHRTSRVEGGVWRVSRHPISNEGVPVRFVWVVRDVTQQSIVNNARNDFVATATHELRTPLTNIKAYAETLAVHEGIDVEQQKEFCNIINAEATRLSRFVDEVLSVSQIESGSMTIERTETDLERLLQEVIQHVEPQMIKKRIRFETKFPPKFAKLNLDKDKFEAALVNLLGNAAKYTPEEGAVTFEVEQRPTHIAFHVEDTGIGIAEDDLSRVFEKFYRSTDDRVGALPGNGLGLAFTHEVVRLHGGKITAESTLNEGSRFTIQLSL